MFSVLFTNNIQGSNYVLKILISVSFRFDIQSHITNESLVLRIFRQNESQNNKNSFNGDKITKE